MKTTNTIIMTLAMAVTLLSCSEKRQATVAPPLPNIKPAFVSSHFDAAEGGVITTETGSVLEVPPNAFIDDQGNPVTGEVEVTYRELQKPEDIFLSGIPMEVSPDSKDEVLSSAVMWEIRANQNGRELEIDSANNKTIRTTIASSVVGGEYDLWAYNEEEGSWTNKAPVAPVANPLRLEADSLGKAAGNELDGLELSNSFVLNYYLNIDVWKKPKDNVFPYFTRSEAGPRDAFLKKLKKRVESFGMQWVASENEYQTVTYYGRDYPAAMVVWEAEKGLPKWVRNMKDGYYNAVRTGRHKYRIYFYKDQRTSQRPVYSVAATIKAPLRTYYQIGAEQWEARQDSVRNVMEAQEKSMATLGTVRRTFEVSKLGIYNYDKLLDKQNDVTVLASFTVEGKPFENKDELVVYVYLKEDKSVIRYYPNELHNFVLYPDADFKVFCVAGPETMAYLPAAELRELAARAPELKKQEEPEVTIDLKLFKHRIVDRASFNNFLEMGEKENGALGMLE